MAIKTLIVCVLPIAFGCAHVAYPNASQPRALAWGSSVPSCLMICIAHTTVTDAESGGATSTVNSTETMSPTVSVK